MWHWWKSVISGEVPLEINSPASFLVEKTLQDGNGQLIQAGALSFKTDDSIGDLYVVIDQLLDIDFDLGPGYLKMVDSDFQLLKNAFLKGINFLKPQTYIMERSLVFLDQFSVGLRFITTLPSHALFIRQLFCEDSQPLFSDFLTIYHYPQGISDWEEDGRIPKKVIALHLKKRELIIAGPSSFEDIKTAILTFISFIAIENNVLPLHAQASLDSFGHASLFFNVLLNKDSENFLRITERPIFDDQILLTDQGAFSLIPGKYWQDHRAKNNVPFFEGVGNNFDPDQKKRSTFLPPFENVHKRWLFWRSSKSLNGRLFIQDIDHLFIFIEDDYGVLPLISKLTSLQAHFYFMNGYMGNNTFKSCCGDPYRLRGLVHYGRLFLNFLKNHQTSVWLVNKGYYGGKANQGTRYPLKLIKECVRRTMQSKNHIDYLKLPMFELSIPSDLEGVDRRFLNPIYLWAKQEDYLQSAAQFEKMLRENFDRLNLEEKKGPPPHFGELNI